MKTLIQNATIVDGSGSAAYRADLLLCADAIENIAAGIEGTFEQVIDAAGLVAAPGFIDTHSHSDLQILTGPAVKSKLLQGITTEVVGQDGISMAPLPVQYVGRWRTLLAGLDGDSDDIDWDYGDMHGYFERIRRHGVTGNIACLAPHGNIRMEAMGLGSGKADAVQIQKMQEILRRELEAGAIGFSTGLVYPPCVYSDAAELRALCGVAAAYDRVFVVHQRSEADEILSSMDELLQIARQTGVKLHISHFKVCGKKNQQKLDEAFALLDGARRGGLQVSVDQYPYTAGSTVLSVILPPYALEGGAQKMLERLRDAAQRTAIRKEIYHKSFAWDNFVEFAGVDGIFITSVRTQKNRSLVGKSLLEIGDLRGIDPVEAAFDLLVEEDNDVCMVDFYGSQEAVDRIALREEHNVCTDGILAGLPHPRTYGAFPKFIREYCRERKLLSLEQCVRKMTGKASQAMGLDDRGLLKKGYKADIVLFDPQAIGDTSTYADPISYPAGIRAVIVNGEIAAEDGEVRKTGCGRLIAIPAST